MPLYHNPNADNNFSTDAEWRAYCVEFETALLASGFLEQTGDTGQLDFATMVRPASGAFAGYRMYRAKDLLAATEPFYIKMEYGIGTASDRFKAQVSAATGSNGAGILTTPTMTVTTIISATSVGSGTARIMGGGGDASAWVYVIDPGITSQGGIFACGRLLDTGDGEPVGPIRWVHCTSGTSGMLFSGNVFWSDGSSVWNNISNGIGSFYPGVDYAMNTGGDINTTLLYQGTVYRAAKTLTFPIVTGKASELPFTDPDGSLFTLNIWGSSHTFVPIPQGGITSSVQRVGLLWE